MDDEKLKGVIAEIHLMVFFGFIGMSIILAILFIATYDKLDDIERKVEPQQQEQQK